MSPYYPYYPATYLPTHLVGPLTDEIATLYEDEARKFFAVPVQQQANKLSLYEDAEGAFMISLFRSVDRRCYYVLNEMRKAINGNARSIVVTFSVFLVLWGFGSLFGLIYLSNAFGVFVVALIITATGIGTLIAMVAERIGVRVS